MEGSLPDSNAKYTNWLCAFSHATAQDTTLLYTLLKFSMRVRHLLLFAHKFSVNFIVAKEQLVQSCCALVGSALHPHPHAIGTHSALTNNCYCSWLMRSSELVIKPAGCFLGKYGCSIIIIDRRQFDKYKSHWKCSAPIFGGSQWHWSS